MWSMKEPVTVAHPAVTVDARALGVEVPTGGAEGMVDAAEQVGADMKVDGAEICVKTATHVTTDIRADTGDTAV